jgi:integrase
VGSAPGDRHVVAGPGGRPEAARRAGIVVDEVDNKLVGGVTKTYERRTVQLPRFLCEQVGAYLVDRPHAPNDLVFTMLQGGPLREPKFAERYFKPAARAAGLPAALRVQDLRHTCASLLIREGASIKAVQHHLGHKSASITLDRYGHHFPEELDHLADRLERLHAQAGVYPGCTDGSVATLGQSKGPGH